MNYIGQLRSMCYPDAYLIRMFYKEGLAQTPERALELGCGSANNLILLVVYGWETIGLDCGANCVVDRRKNLPTAGPGAVIQHDLNAGLSSLSGRFDALLIPSALYHLTR